MEQKTKKRIRRTASLLVVAGLGAGGWVAYGSEPGQRAVGRREYFRAHPVVEAPDLASATISTRFEAIRSAETSTERYDIVATIDAANQRARVDTTSVPTDLTATGQSVPASATGVSTPSPAMSTEVITIDATYEPGATDADPWTRASRAPDTWGTWIDPHVIPTYVELVGFELESMHSWDPLIGGGPLDLASQTAEIDGMIEANGATTTAAQEAPERTPTDVPAEVVRLMRWSTDMASLRHLSPLTMSMLGLIAPDDAPVVFTLGFDSAGLARYIDASISLSDAMVGLDTESMVFQWIEWRVLGVSDDPVTIDLPVNVVDAPVT